MDMVLQEALHHIFTIIVLPRVQGGLHEPKTVLTGGPPGEGCFELERSNLEHSRKAMNDNFCDLFN